MRQAELETYRLHAGLGSYRRRVVEAKRTAVEAIAIPGLWACCVSGGKDSTVLAHLCHATGWRGPLFHFRHEETPQENTALCHVLAKQLELELHTVAVPGAFDVYARAGRFFIHPDTPEERAAVNWMLAAYKQAAADASEQLGYVGQFWGLRALESRPRAITLARKGALYQTLDRVTWTSCPLRHWSGRDVWAYLLAHDLPWLSSYDSAIDRERARSEITWLAAEGIWRYGQGQALRRERPAEWARLLRMFPELSRWG